MSLLDDARGLADGLQPIHYAGISRKVRNGVTGWERWRCTMCFAETLKQYHKEIQHKPDCPWLAMPRIVAALEAADVFCDAYRRGISDVMESPENPIALGVAQLTMLQAASALVKALRGAPLTGITD